MSTTYSIYFENKYGERQNYAFFCEAPTVTSNTGKPTVYSNIFLSQNVAVDGNWTIDITKTYYAWCGVGPQSLAPGVKVTSGNGKLVTLGTNSSPGSTWTVENNGGSPAFLDTQEFTANPGAFEIDTDTDFTDNQNFLIGLGAVDGVGRMKPAATMKAPRNAMVNIAPVTKFYIGSFSSSVGTVINTTTASKNAALIDFTANPGQFGATVTQQANGRFDVIYYTQPAQFYEAVEAKKANQSTSMLDVGIKRELEKILRMIDLQNGGPIYMCSIDWKGNPTWEQKEYVYRSLRKYMENHGYKYFSDREPANKKEIWFQHPQPWSLDNAVSDWTAGWAKDETVRGLCGNPQVAEDPNAIKTQTKKLLAANGGVNMVEA